MDQKLYLLLFCYGLIAFFECIVLRVVLSRHASIFFPQISKDYLQVFKRFFPNIISLVYTALMWALLSQADRLIFSNFLSVEEFGYFTFVAVLSSAILSLSAPLASSFTPKLVYILRENGIKHLADIYCEYAFLLSAITFSAALLLSQNAEIILYLWTQNHEASAKGAESLPYYAFAAGVLGASAALFHLQSVLGRLKYHTIGSTLSLLVIPLTIYSFELAGLVGAAIGILSFRLLFFFAWGPFVYSRLIPGLAGRFLANVIFPLFLMLVVQYAASNFLGLIFGLRNVYLTLSIDALVCIVFAGWFIKFYSLQILTSKRES